MDESDDRTNWVNIGELPERLTAYLRVHARFLASDHEDLVQQTLIGMLDRGQPNTDLYSMPVALAILRRRIADRYRYLSRNAVESPLEDEAGQLPFARDVADSAAYEELLKTARDMIECLDERDRGLLLDHALSGTRTTPWTDAERQQLRRLRMRLRDQLAKKFKMSPRDILKD